MNISNKEYNRLLRDRDQARAALSVYRVRAPMLLHVAGRTAQGREAIPCGCPSCEYLRDTIDMAAEALGDTA